MVEVDCPECGASCKGGFGVAVHWNFVHEGEPPEDFDTSMSKDHRKAISEGKIKRLNSDPVDEFWEILEGELLGDGYLDWEPGRSPDFQYSSQYEEYRDFLMKVFSNEGFEVHPSESNGQYWFRSQRAECLTRFAERWYPGGEKSVPDNITLTPLTLRHWFIGDGSRSLKSNPSPSVYLSNYSFSGNGLERLKCEFARIGIEASVWDSGIGIHLDSHENFYRHMASLPGELEGVYGYKWPG